jgi:hypothetical protein
VELAVPADQEALVAVVAVVAVDTTLLVRV